MADRAVPNLPSRDFDATVAFYSGFGFEQSFEANRLYWAAVVGGELSFRLTGSLFLPLGLFAEIPLTRDQFVARDVEEPLYRVGPVAGRAAIALEFRGGS